MAMDPMDREPNLYNRDADLYETETRGSNTLAYLIAGLVVALGLLAFLFYSGGNREPTTTGSTPTQTEPRTAPEPPTSAPATPMSPNTGNPTTPNQ
ncbi:hypothetical protein [Microvirga terricola]|uniref:Uncharacterized protein n=1 Tax=Microvirga terricola TaxID=2719797 RepID=A0ABX0VBY0_9HYPH|nr:hypothetical protein [Microvirga terricola]NIX77203.1 hypothetical protein [Microvirga terricola]